jgi:hypothetical protein
VRDLQARVAGDRFIQVAAAPHGRSPGSLAEADEEDLAGVHRVRQLVAQGAAGESRSRQGRLDQAEARRGRDRIGPGGEVHRRPERALRQRLAEIEGRLPRAVGRDDLLNPRECHLVRHDVLGEAEPDDLPPGEKPLP